MDKYGKTVRIWSQHVYLPNWENGSDGQYLEGNQQQITYNYIKKRQGDAPERDPPRNFSFHDPNNYHRDLTKNRPLFISDNCYAVNGVCDKADGTFLYGFFFTEVKPDK